MVDASALVEMLLRTDRGLRVEEMLLGGDETLHAPQLLDVEAVQTFRKLVLRDSLPSARAGEAIEDLALLDIIRHPHPELVPRLWELRGNLTAYDAAYVALAEALPATLVTCDGSLARSPGHDAIIGLVE